MLLIFTLCKVSEYVPYDTIWYISVEKITEKSSAFLPFSHRFFRRLDVGILMIFEKPLEKMLSVNNLSRNTGQPKYVGR